MTTKLEQAARHALEALINGNNEWPRLDVTEAITALREALAEQAEQEPVAIQRFGLNPDNGLMYESERGPWCLYKDVAPVEPVKQEPVAWMDLHKELGKLRWMGGDEGWDNAINAVRDRLIELATPHPVRTKDLTEPLIDELRECRDLLMCVESCSRNNFENLAYERVQAIDAVIAADRKLNGVEK